jgi:Ca2+-binding RTX toxin-like protein
MKLSSKVLLMVVAMLIVQESSAEMYTHVTATQVTLKSDTGKAKPLAATVKLGYRLSEGIALEYQYGTNGSDDSLADGKVEIDKLSAIFVKLGGQSTYNGVRMYLLLGTTKTEVKYSGVTSALESKFEGTAWGLGLEEMSQSVRNMSYVLEYIRYAEDKGTEVTGIGLGVRYNF